MPIRSKTNSKNYLSNYDKVFQKGLKNIEEIDKSLEAKAKKALTKVIENPELASNPIVILAVEHIHDEIEQLEVKQILEEAKEITQEELKPREMYRKRRKKDTEESNG